MLAFKSIKLPVFFKYRLSKGFIFQKASDFFAFFQNAKYLIFYTWYISYCLVHLCRYFNEPCNKTLWISFAQWPEYLLSLLSNSNRVNIALIVLLALLWTMGKYFSDHVTCQAMNYKKPSSIGAGQGQQYWGSLRAAVLGRPRAAVLEQAKGSSIWAGQEQQYWSRLSAVVLGQAKGSSTGAGQGQQYWGR